MDRGCAWEDKQASEPSDAIEACANVAGHHWFGDWGGVPAIHMYT